MENVVVSIVVIQDQENRTGKTVLAVGNKTRM